MSYRDEGDIMSAFFGGRININDEDSTEQKVVEVGHGTGIGHKDGSYQKYVKQLSERKGEANIIIYLGKAINTNENILSIVDGTDKFTTKDIPKLLIMYHDVINKTFVKVAWKNESDDIILEQYYEIPAPQTMKYTWWDTYSAYFIGPENLDEGKYNIEITSTDITNISQKQRESTCIMDFVMIDPPDESNEE